MIHDILTQKNYDDCNTLDQIYRYIKYCMSKKRFANCKKLMLLEQQFKELYGRAKIKEKECREKGYTSIPFPFEFFSCSNLRDRFILGQLKQKASVYHGKQLH